MNISSAHIIIVSKYKIFNGPNTCIFWHFPGFMATSTLSVTSDFIIGLYVVGCWNVMQMFFLVKLMKQLATYILSILESGKEVIQHRMLDGFFAIIRF